MALEVSWQRLCRVLHTKNGRRPIRRIHTILMQMANGQVHQLDGRSLPDIVPIYPGIPYRGVHTAEVLLSPKEAKAAHYQANQRGWLKRWEAFLIMLGVLFFGLIVALTRALK